MSITKCIFPVAGFGTRFLPVTKVIPKEMLPILTKPLIQYGVEEAISANLHEVTMITSKYKSAIKKHFEPHEEIEKLLKLTNKEKFLEEVNFVSSICKFNYLDQKKMLGLGHAIYTCKPQVGSESFAVILPDDLCVNDEDSVIQQMINIQKQHPDCCVVAVEQVPLEDISKYGVIKGELLPGSNNTFRVGDMVEKPNSVNAPSNLAIIGRYILTNQIFEEVERTLPDKNNEIQITDALSKLAKKGKVIAYKFTGKRFDCGTLKGFINATNYFANKHEIF